MEKYTLTVDDGNIFYYKEEAGILHRENGPAIEYANGTKEWYKEGELHRLDGPAVEYPNGDKEWHLNGRLHRLNGPAVELVDGTKEWYIKGEGYSEAEYNSIINNNKIKKPKKITKVVEEENIGIFNVKLMMIENSHRVKCFVGDREIDNVAIENDYGDYYIARHYYDATCYTIKNILPEVASQITTFLCNTKE